MKKSILITSLGFLTLLFSGCSVAGSPEPKIDPTLPKAQNIKTISDIGSVAFEWDTIKDHRIAGFRFYRNNPKEGDGKLYEIHELKDRYATHHTDTELQPDTQYRYQIVVMGADGKESERSELVSAKTAAIEPVTFLRSLSNYPRRVKLIWRPHNSPRVEGYIIERNDLSRAEFERIGEVKGRLQAEYFDKELKDNAVYRYRIRAKTYDGYISSPSEVTEAKTKPLPQQIKGLKTTSDLPRKIKITWEQNQEQDVTWYQVYRSSFEGYLFLPKYKINSLEVNDEINEDGATYFYKVTAIDKDGLESEMPPYSVPGSTLRPPATPILNSATIQDNKVVVRWSRADQRAASYIVIKKGADLIDVFGKEMRFNNIKDEMFVDQDIVPGVKYKYSVAAVDEFSIQSKPTQEVELLLPQEKKPQ